MNKICTDIEQSKKLTKILPIESADMTYRPIMDIDSMSNSGFLNIPECYPFNEFKDCIIKPLPCWSLSALLNYFREIDFFPEIDTDEHGVTMNIDYYDEDEGKLLNPVHNIEVKAENFIDACYRMIEKLHTKNLI